jgi:putative endonuclease
VGAQAGFGRGVHEKYGVHDLVWYEQHADMLAAIAREKTLKEWKRSWKLELIEKMNPEWKDLCEGLV